MITANNKTELAPPKTSLPLKVDDSFIAVDWEHPLFFGISQIIPEITTLSEWPGLDFFNELAARRHLQLADGRKISFVHQPKKPSRWRRRTVRKLRYEESVLQQAIIPTRLCSWHDFFNNLSWITFPLAKMSLVERLAAAAENRTAYDIERGQFRSREGDRLAMLDEGGLIRCADRLIVFGHALQESFVLNRFDIWGLTVPFANVKHSVQNPGDLIAAVDKDLAALINAGYFAKESPGFESTCMRDFTGR